MADINLLGNTEKHDYARTGVGLAVKVLTAVLILVALYYVYLRIQVSRTNNNAQDIQVRTSQQEAEALSRPERGQVVTRQGQLQNLDALIKNHVYWSPLLPELARVTLKSASYASFTADANGILNLEVLVPDYAAADKYLQIFDLPEFNQQFSDVRVLAISKVQQGNAIQTQLRLQLKFNPNFIHKTLQ